MNTDKYNFISRSSHLCNLCGSDEQRPLLDNILFNEGNAICSDGHVMLVIPIVEISNLEGADIEKLEGKILNKKAFKDLLKFDRISAIEDDGICAMMNSDDARTSYEVKIKFVKDSKYPDYKSVMTIKSPLPFNEEISFVPSRLREMCVAVGENMPILKPNGGSVIIIRFRDSKAKGLLMQCFIGEVEVIHQK